MHHWLRKSVCFSSLLFLSAVGNDVTVVDTNITMDQGTFTGRVRVSVVNDDIYEADEDFTIRITEVSSGIIDPDRQEVTVTILDESSEQLILIHFLCILL